MLGKINLKSKRNITIGGALAVSVILCIVLAIKISAKRTEEEDIKIYDYTAEEQALADAVKGYLAQNLELTERANCEIADTAVENYNIVIASDTDVINDEITDAVRKRIRSTIFAFSDQPETLSDETLDAVSSGVTEIIWDAVISALESVQITENLPDSYKEDYEYLIQSLQGQIDTLKERKTKVSINANINANKDIDITGEDILAGVQDMDETELEELADKLGISLDQLRELLEKSMSKSNGELTDSMKKDLEKEINDLRKELQKEISKTSGKEGTAGKAGQKGEKGEKGADGKSGNDGKTTYIAYADDANGTNFSLTPTESSKYIGTCITSAAQQPTDHAQYSNWQEYRTYIITSTTDQDTGVTTVHIN